MRTNITMMTKWINGNITCSCPLINQCNKCHGCEPIVFTYNPYAGIKDSMDHASYNRVRGAVSQRR